MTIHMDGVIINNSNDTETMMLMTPRIMQPAVRGVMDTSDVLWGFT